VSTSVVSPSLSCAAIAEKLLEEYPQDAAEDRDRRNAPRRIFDCWQLVAEFDGETLPVQQDFQLQLCHDISAGGISFLAEVRPRSENLVIALGVIPFVFFHVRFVRAVRRNDLEGSPLQIGCQFVKRLAG
jgi:hypothetical protein